MEGKYRCPDCQEDLIKATLKVSQEDVYLVSSLGEDYSLLNAWVCPLCRNLVLKATTPAHLVDPEEKRKKF